jgi:hypothetical protein
MPRRKINYENTLIYKIVCNDLNVTDTYCGHTTNFNERKNSHKSVCNSENSPSYNLKVYKTIRENGGFENWSMIQIEEFPCKNRREAGAREHFQYEILNSRMNSQVPNRSRKQHYEDNREALLLYNKQYKETNQEAISLYQKQHYEENREALLLYNKQYKETNQEAISLYQKQYEKQNYLCDCGRNIRHREKSRHLKSKIHLKFMNLIPDN